MIYKFPRLRCGRLFGRISKLVQVQNYRCMMSVGKQAAAEACVNAHCKSNQVIGIGSGSTVIPAVARIGALFRSGELANIRCVPSSFQARQLIVENELPLSDLEITPRVDVYIDGADEVDKALNCIKGGGACLTQEKIVMSCAKTFYIVAHSSKYVDVLGTNWKTLPIEVIPQAWKPISLRIEEQLGGKVTLRAGKAKAGPVVTDTSNFVLDWTFPSAAVRTNSTPLSEEALVALNTQLLAMPGLVETGLFVGCAEAAYFGTDDGKVERYERAG